MQKLLRQFMGFLVVGGLATIIDFVVLYVLHELGGMHYLWATAWAFVLATVFNYWASLRYVFVSRYNRSERGKEIGIFLILSLLGLLLTQGLMYLVVDGLGGPVMLSKVLVTAVVMLFNFITRKIFIEGKPDVHSEKEGLRE